MAQRPGWGPRRLKTLASCDLIGIFQRRRAGPPMRSGGWQSYVPRGCGKGNPGHLRLSGQGPLPYPQGHPRALARWAFQHGRLPVEQDDVPERVFQQDGIVGRINKHQSDTLQSWTHPTRWQMRRRGHGGGPRNLSDTSGSQVGFSNMAAHFLDAKTEPFCREGLCPAVRFSQTRPR